MTASTVEIIRPPEPPGAVTWIRQNLFNNWFNGILTLASLAFVLWAANGVIRWMIVAADWRPVVNHPLLYLVGQYPRNMLWRPGVSILIISFLVGLSWRKWGGVLRTLAVAQAVFTLIMALWPSQVALALNMRIFFGANIPVIALGFFLGGFKVANPRTILIAWLLSPVLILLLWSGWSRIPWIPVVPTGQWGGLMVTLFLAVGGIVLSFPIGVLLALGRRSSLPVVKMVCTTFIEVIRGVPLITLLFIVSLIIALFLPAEVRFDRLLRALVAMIVFSAAYVAENVRGGLAAVPYGQIEAARALGLNNFKVTALIVLPQALRAVIPPTVGQFISLFKDTTLAAGIAVFELLSVGRAVLQANQEYLRLQMEIFLFIAIVFWVFSYLMSYASLKLEVALGIGER